jgi:hypothetical protein
MNGKIRVALWIYVTGIVLLELSALHSAYLTGGFSRIQSARDVLLGVATSLAVSALWPIIALMLALQLLGLLPFPLNF